MQNELDLLIEHLQKERDYLKSEMEQCAECYDFAGAESFKGPFYIVSRKLNIAKSIKNPNSRKISHLKGFIANSDNAIKRVTRKNNSVDDKKNARRQEQFEKMFNVRLEESKLELANLESIKHRPKADNDNLLLAIERLLGGEVSKLQLEIIEDSTFCIIWQSDDSLNLSIAFKNDLNKKRYLTNIKLNVLIKLGFDLETLTINLSERGELLNKLVLEILSILIYEIFEMTGPNFETITLREVEIK